MLSSVLLAAWNGYGLAISFVCVGVIVLFWWKKQQGKSSHASFLSATLLGGDTKSEADYRGDSKLQIKDFERHRRQIPKRVNGNKIRTTPAKVGGGHTRIQPLFFFFSLTGSTNRRAEKALQRASEHFKRQDSSILEPQLVDLAAIDHEDFFEHAPMLHQSQEIIKYFYLLLIPSYDIDTILDSVLKLFEDIHNDFRIDTAPLSCLAGYSVFGLGDKDGWSSVANGFCSQALDFDRWMAKLTGQKRAFPVGMGDVKSDADARFDEWTAGVLSTLTDVAASGSLGEGVVGSGEAFESDEEDIKTPNSNHSERSQKGRPSSIGDLEDIGGKAPGSSPLPIDFTTSLQPQGPKPMVPISSPTYTALTKQGYTIIGTHSGVKICRWTKSALRGRGSCYKYSFYGIQSHLCMETTPSLSCSNKCVFCWRHGTNPVGTSWRWQVDPPEMIFEGAKEGHYKKIKMMRGVPGVRAERFQEAMRIRHCALSLVGEPIFYPHINEFVSMLHRERISSFLVCNAQHPDQLAALKPVTQLYVSIDASNAESLKKIDRPLHRDYWQRFTRCLGILREKRMQMRTVFRLTLVKGFNIEEEVEGYADLVAKGLPCFVEIKGVTYCGTSTSASAGLTMQNVPFYEEIVAFVEALNVALERRGLDYGIAAEHAHSCCALIASRRFFVEGKWHTLIDYEKFFELWQKGRKFSPEDYMGPPTPEWANWGNGGFDPRDQRVDRKGRAIAT
ncbi:uncharacterized protein KY384_007645 [Bacidia gigantensis]|uniref:uncharacterized protein n=1 Tax=Bacidia gigantensis TaxID=2732470 RepID=UPI001D03AE09|nr:uncharacterized protein KY384_007645 [Bacidia gigantensis]KAG8527493.1 hypothetical protein KY384_007645 [Bacidia gigantensis]